MAINVRAWYVLKIAVADDAQGKQVRHHSVGIKRDTAEPAVEDPWATVLTNVNAYLAALNAIIDGVVMGWTVSRTAVLDAPPNAPSSAENERKGVFPMADVNGRKGSLEIPSLDEEVLIAEGVGAGLYVDPENAAVIGYLALVGGGNYLVPRDGVVIDYAVAGKKFHRTSGWVRERVG